MLNKAHTYYKAIQVNNQDVNRQQNKAMMKQRTLYHNTKCQESKSAGKIKNLPPLPPTPKDKFSLRFDLINSGHYM